MRAFFGYPGFDIEYAPLFELRAAMVDEVQLRICPTTRCEGVRMFTVQHNFELIETKPYERGMVVSKYKSLG